MGKKVSIIIPSYNRYPLNLYSLQALANQSIDPKKFEVIFIDDASTDKTSQLANYCPPFTFRYLRNDRNLGVARSRNKGIQHTTGEIVLFLDAEMIVGPDYINNHIKHHKKNKKAVVIGGTVGIKSYTCAYPDFKRGQIKDIKKLAKMNPSLSKKLGSLTNEISSTIRNLKEPFPIIDEREIKDLSLLDKYSLFNKYKHINTMVTRLGDKFKKSPISWMACLGNLSVNADFLREVGGFDEDFTEWGCEDVELGYRLFQHGAMFIVDSEIKRYHQEHPESPMKKEEWKKNQNLFQTKHPVIDVCIRSLKLIRKQDFLFMHKCVVEDHALQKLHPLKFDAFLKSIIMMLQEIECLRARCLPLDNCFQQVIPDSDLRKQIISERDKIKGLGRYEHIVELFDALIEL